MHADRSANLLVSVGSYQEEDTLCCLLCEHLLAMLQQGLKEPQAEMQRLARLQLLSVTLSAMCPQLARHEIRKLSERPMADVGDTELLSLLLVCPCIVHNTGVALGVCIPVH